MSCRPSPGNYYGHIHTSFSWLHQMGTRIWTSDLLILASALPSKLCPCPHHLMRFALLQNLHFNHKTVRLGMELSVGIHLTLQALSCRKENRTTLIFFSHVHWVHWKSLWILVKSRKGPFKLIPKAFKREKVWRYTKKRLNWRNITYFEIAFAGTWPLGVKRKHFLSQNNCFQISQIKLNLFLIIVSF